MKITKTQMKNYLVDCMGYGEEEAGKICSVYGTTYLSEEEKNACIAFSE